MSHSAEKDTPDLTDPEALVSVHNRAGGGWSGFRAIATAIEARFLPPADDQEATDE